MRSDLYLGLAGAALVCAVPGNSWAQTATPPSGLPATPLEEVIVTGIRASQREAIDIKKLAVNSVDAIASEDLGKRTRAFSDQPGIRPIDEHGAAVGIGRLEEARDG